MLKALSMILICGTAVTALCQSDPSNQTSSGSPPIVVPQQRRPTKSTMIIGLGGVKERTEGTLDIEDGKLCFVHSGTTSQIPATAIEDVVTADDSQRVIRGTLGTVKYQLPADSETRTMVSGMEQRLVQIGTDIRHLSHELHPALLQEAGL